MNTHFRKFNSKILLFGEYTLLLGSKALTIPLRQFGGLAEIKLPFTGTQMVSNQSLFDFYTYLDENKPCFPPGLNIDFERFQTDLKRGLFLNSDIPQGYGVGSSGVVVASIYERYAKNPLVPEKKTDLRKLKTCFSFMESYFHGKSSGIDPLACYSGRPILISPAGNIEFINFPYEINNKTLNVFLLDTGRSSKTQGLVEFFLDKSSNPAFSEILKNEIIPLCNSCIESILAGSTDSFFEDIRSFSALQLQNFDLMIPGDCTSVWKNGIETGDYSLKLCGSGGGGFILGFTNNFEKLKGKFKFPVIKLGKLG